MSGDVLYLIYNCYYNLRVSRGRSRASALNYQIKTTCLASRYKLSPRFKSNSSTESSPPVHCAGSLPKVENALDILAAVLKDPHIRFYYRMPS